MIFFPWSKGAGFLPVAAFAEAGVSPEFLASEAEEDWEQPVATRAVRETRDAAARGSLERDMGISEWCGSAGAPVVRENRGVKSAGKDRERPEEGDQ
ncbi:hypothetical protein SPAR_22464 [Streptomyces sparsogenes DSM 40356]|uniref:Uncharacterized protein n=1 Tax=Streptomyces sparsogenes DSM 40356 TaxID=1331668 RepID=A0A1R1SG00_9ACTN|nr:hypothetical protein SPAR_22464 [Streptomyces sparsogenes DSM 40356]